MNKNLGIMSEQVSRYGRSSFVDSTLIAIKDIQNKYQNSIIELGLRKKFLQISELTDNFVSDNHIEKSTIISAVFEILQEVEVELVLIIDEHERIEEEGPLENKINEKKIDLYKDFHKDLSRILRIIEQSRFCKK